MDFDLVTSVNLVLSLLVVIAGYIAYRRDGSPPWLYVALGFSLFALSHLVNLLGAGELLYVPMVGVRALGYLLVLFGVYKAAPAKAPPKEGIPPVAAKRASRKK